MRESFNVLRDLLDTYRPSLEPFEAKYRLIHANPELSGKESDTASTIAQFFRKQLPKYDLVTNIGGHGLVGIFRNQEGPTVLLRSEMDALPILEKTDLPYASKKRMIDDDGEEKPVFHGCGHDLHMICLMAAATLLYRARSRWTGTLIILFQPAEENFAGAKAMVEDGLYDKIPIPNIILAQHCVKSKAGTVAIRSGPVLTACSAYDVTMRGRGGHGSSPESSIDPIIAASQAIIRLQTIVSREVSPKDFAVVTCGSFHAGTSPGIIPDSANFKISIRAYSEAVMNRATDSVRRIVESEAHASGMLEKPDIRLIQAAPLTSNDSDATEVLRCCFVDYFGDKLSIMEPDTASEDFADLAEPHNTPYVYWNFGTTNPKKWEEARRKSQLNLIPGNHSSYFCPEIEPSLSTGMEALALAALTFLKVTTRNHDQRM